SYGVNLPSSLSRVLSSALGYSPRPPVSVYGTDTAAINSTGAFLGSVGSLSLWAQAPSSSPLGLRSAVCGTSPPSRSPYRFERGNPTTPLSYPSPSLLWKSSTVVQEY